MPQVTRYDGSSLDDLTVLFQSLGARIRWGLQTLWPGEARQVNFS